MQQITINGKYFQVTFIQGGVEVEFLDDNTGLNTVMVFKDLHITDRGIRTKIRQYQITPNGSRINEVIYKKATSQQDYEYFVNSPMAEHILKSIVNGIFRFIIGNTHSVYNASGELITEQPHFPSNE